LYSLSRENIIDLRHGRMTNEDALAPSYDVRVFLDGNECIPEWDANASGIHDGYVFGRARKGVIGLDPSAPLFFDGVKTVKQTVDHYNKNIFWNKVIYNQSNENDVPVSGVVNFSAGHYRVDHENGNINFWQSTTGNISVDYHYENGSTWYMRPYPGKKINMLLSEVQFTKDVIMFSPTNFELWGYDPTGQVAPPTKVLLLKENYKSLKDLISTGNQGQGYIPALPQNPIDTVVFPFDYTGEKVLKYSYGMELRVSVDYDIPVSGTFATSTFYVNIEDDV
jgi:hypothetical protein